LIRTPHAVIVDIEPAAEIGAGPRGVLYIKAERRIGARSEGREDGYPVFVIASVDVVASGRCIGLAIRIGIRSGTDRQAGNDSVHRAVVSRQGWVRSRSVTVIENRLVAEIHVENGLAG